MTTRYCLITDAPRPDFRLFITFLWSDDHNVDVDGDAEHPASRSWTDLYCVDRDSQDDQFEIEIVNQGEQSILIESRRSTIASRVALFLSEEIGSDVFPSPKAGTPVDRAALVSECGADFDVSAAFDRTRRSRWRRATEEDPYPKAST